MNGLVVTFGSTVLAAGTIASTIVVDMANGQTRDIQTSSPILADVVAFIDFLTQEGAVSFEVEQTHDSLALALDHHFRHAQGALGVADLIVEWTDEADVVHRWTAANAKLEAARASSLPMGVSTRTAYTGGVAQWTYTNSEGGTLPSIPMRTGGDFQTLTPSAAGTDNVALATNARELDLLIVPTAGSGSYTRKVALGIDGLEKGCTCTVRIEMPAHANPTVALYNDTDTGTALLPASVVGDAAKARAYVGTFAYTGTAWRRMAFAEEPS